MRPTNIVFILTDNQDAWTLACCGNPDIRTPNIDRLAAEGVCFTHAQSSDPVCSPTRATFLAGLIPCMTSGKGGGTKLRRHVPNASSSPLAL